MENFGEIKNTFSEILIESILKGDSKLKKVFQKYIKMLKENEVLRAQSIIYNNLEKDVNPDSKIASMYVEANISLLKALDENAVKVGNEKLIKLANEYKKGITINYDENLKKLHENINLMVTSDLSPNNIKKILEAKSYITTHIVNNKNKEPISESLVPTTTLTKFSIKKLNEKYGNLTEDEKKLIKSISSSNSEQRKEMLTTINNECLSLVNTKLTEANIDVKSKLLDVKERLLNLNYTDESFSTDYTKLIELKESLS